ncbi:P-loop containing nucleoside triphosphate hydrolase protein [Multifurca ochricompacta]|uniref:P-loop containing nucleoside triphosphate hydrolase protein n=1 Tax=Multifurca ochricompacta TaxID=376703 RepID=A0AAD4M6W9_9AGAM|nr:P-loop containing nucleoside triphosphate hydrolase protein [Multifurca ochricompacta]
MVKRRTAIDSDNDQDDRLGSPSDAKRSRLNVTEIEGQVELGNDQSSKLKGKGKARDDSDILNDIRVDDDDDIAAIRDTHAEDDEGAQERFEEEHEESIRESIRQRNKHQGGVAKFGIIEAIEMHQFMCHKYLTFKFGPQINFIIGHNGSGKSAVLTAITVALGGKATSTGRGNGLKAFIREGQPAAEVSIHLKNQGEEAYKHDLYGHSIVITRRFTKEGASSYKIKSKDGKLISTKREELSAICDHMNIQVDNPMNVLTQDAARQFLSSSHPSDKYKFFLRGTQLSQLSEEYETCLENISQTSKVLLRKKEAIPDLQVHYKEVLTRFEEASKAREQRHKADELKKELAWAHVAAKQEEVTEKATEVHKLEQRIPKIQRSLEEVDGKFTAATAAVEVHEREHENLGNIDHLIEKKRTLGETMRANRAKLSDLKTDERSISENLTSTKKAIQGLESRMEAERARVAAYSQSKQDELSQRLQQAAVDVQATETNLKEAEALVREKQEEAKTLQEQGDRVDREIHNARNSVMGLHEQIQRCIEQRNNTLAPYGRDLKNVLERIGKMRWHGQKPLGPLGVYVKVKDHTWASLLRNVIGAHMASFVVTDGRDLPVLKRLLKESGNPNTNVFVSEVDLFNYRSGEPEPQYPTILRAIDVSDDFVLRILINQAKIERTLLAPTRKAADELLSGITAGGQCLTADLWRVQRWGDGGGQSQPIPPLRAGDPRNLLFTGQDAETQLQYWQGQSAAAEANIRTLTSQLSELRDRFTQPNARRKIEPYDPNQFHLALLVLHVSKRQCRDFRRQLAELRAARDSLQTEANDSVLVEVSGLDEALRDMITEKESLMAQYKSIAEQKAVIDQAQAPLLKELNDVKKQIEAFDGRRQEAQAQVAHAAEQRLAAQHEQQHWSKKLLEEEKKVGDAKEQLNINWTAEAEQYCARVHNPRKVQVVQRNLESVQAALKEREKRQGASVEEMAVEVNKARAALETAQKDLKSMASLNRALKQSLRLRLEKWHDFRRHIAFRCKVVFQYHLSNRGYFGKVLFNHHDGTLQLRVQTDDLNGTQGGNRDKDPRSLSGGEKSFATICLLLAMWESIGSPIRCLDEFDVFMDAVNRRISMKMMIDTANSSDGKQYILITPQNMQNIHVGPTVRVHRMSDPERGQGTLAGGSSVA